MNSMTEEQIESEIQNAMKNESGFPYEVVKKLNDHGIWLTFTNSGIRWSKKPFN